MAGGAGDDTYFIDDPGDVVVEDAGGGIDTVVVSVGLDAAPTNIEDVQLVGGGHALTGNAGDNTLSGNGGDDTLDGGRGDDLDSAATATTC